MEAYRKDKKVGLITFILGIIFMMAACHMTAQEKCINRGKLYELHPEVSTFWACSSMYTKSSYLIIQADSIDPSKYRFHIVVTYPKKDTIINPELQITINNHGVYKIRDKDAFVFDNHVYFNVSQAIYYLLKTSDVGDVISINNNNNYHFDNTHSPDYFKNFIKSLGF
jgi:hypothetical protein